MAAARKKENGTDIIQMVHMVIEPPFYISAD